MKVLLLFSAIILFANCTKPAEAVDVAKTTAPTPTINSNQITVANLTPLSKEESDAIDKAKQKEMEIEAEKLKKILAEFKNIDFENFSYSTKHHGKIKLKNDDISIDEDGGGTRYNLTDIYYTDLTNDGQKEAIVHLFSVSCGGSCNGGSDLFYIYKAGPKKLRLIWHFETGSAGFGCGLKNFTVKDKQINLEVFGRCDLKNNHLELTDNSDQIGKFTTRNATKFVFGFNDLQIVQKEKVFETVPEQNSILEREIINIID